MRGQVVSESSWALTTWNAEFEFAARLATTFVSGFATGGDLPIKALAHLGEGDGRRRASSS